MLTRTRPSRRRAATGAASVLALVTAGLAATASGTEVAAAVGERIENTVGARLRAREPQSAAPSAPAASSAPAAPAAREAVARPRAHHVTMVRNGKATTYEGEAADAYVAENGLALPPEPPVPPSSPGTVAPPAPPLPPLGAVLRPMQGMPRAFLFRRDGRGFAPIVTERFCAPDRDGDPRRLTLTENKDGRRVTVICRNRIDAVADAARGAYARRHGLDAALASIESARVAIRLNDALSESARREALEGLDEAVAELRKEMATRD